jgi:hypothetical protein
MTLQSTVRGAFAGILLLACVGMVAGQSSRSGHWWLEISQERRLGFVAGFVDCDVYEVGETRLAGLSWDDLAIDMAQMLATDAGQRGHPVSAVLLERAPRHKRSVLEGGETYPEKHGIFNGDYWRVATPDHRLGFVEGYLECREAIGKRGARFTRSPERYREEISRWYEARSESLAVRTKRGDEKIANVLERLADH